MIKFFRKIRQQLLSQNRISKYLLYAVGEIVLVVIGILIALSINNWNEEKKNKRAAVEIYKNLQYSLKQDSSEVVKILGLQKKSLQTQKRIFLNNVDEFEAEIANGKLDSIIQDLLFGAFSLYPKNGIYNLIVSNNEMDLLESDVIKRALNNLYEFSYKRYENLDPVIEHKFQYQMSPLVSKKIGFVIEFDSGVEIVSNAVPKLFRENYDELSEECRDLFSVLSSINDLLKNIELEINELLSLIEIEIELELEKNR